MSALEDAIRGGINFLLVTVIAPLVLLVFAFLALAGWNAATNRCETRTHTEAVSPNAQWAVVRSRTSCLHDRDTRPSRFALLRASQPFDDSRVFFEAYTQEDDDDVVFAKWDNDQQLTLASPERFGSGKPVRTFPGLTIRYATYPNDPEVSRDPGSHRVMRKPISVDLAFEENHGIGLPGLGCSLSAKGQDGQYLGLLAFRLSSQLTFPHQFKNGSRVEYTPARSSGSVLIWSDQEINSTTTHVTSARVGERLPLRRNAWLSADRYGHAWQLIDAVRLEDVSTNVASLRQGELTVRVAFWFENTEIIYEVQTPTDLNSITRFDDCLFRQRNEQGSTP